MSRTLPIVAPLPPGTGALPPDERLEAPVYRWRLRWRIDGSGAERLPAPASGAPADDGGFARPVTVARRF